MGVSAALCITKYIKHAGTVDFNLLIWSAGTFYIQALYVMLTCPVLKMRARVLYTNGQQTVDLLWLSHDGKDVYCGQPGFDEKRSYHESGKVHSHSEGERTDEGWHAPLKDIKKQFHLRTIALQSSKEWFDKVSNKIKYSGGKSDAVLTIDSRSIPENTLINVSVGLLEPGRLDILQSMVTMKNDDIPLTSKQFLVSTEVEPWVYVVLYWTTPT